MGQLLERFFQEKKETLVKNGDEASGIVAEVLKKGLRKGTYILRSGRSTGYYFNFDCIY